MQMFAGKILTCDVTWCLWIGWPTGLLAFSDMEGDRDKIYTEYIYLGADIITSADIIFNRIFAMNNLIIRKNRIYGHPYTRMTC